MSISNELQIALDKMFSLMKLDYERFMDPNKSGIDKTAIEIRLKMNKEYCSSIRVEEGRNYLKIIQGTSVHSFIVIKDNPKKGFKVGDILKAATWAAPATNFTRGNVLADKIDRVRWTGVL